MDTERCADSLCVGLEVLIYQRIERGLERAHVPPALGSCPLPTHWASHPAAPLCCCRASDTLDTHGDTDRGLMSVVFTVDGRTEPRRDGAELILTHCLSKADR